MRYQTDAISANILLNESYYEEQHVYRLEWEPPNEDGSGGYLRWFVDGNLITGIHGESLQAASNTEIPSEPMYFLINIAISKDWAFPDAYFLNCQDKCYDCENPACRSCALPEGFCENLPAVFEIDYVRVYQVEREPKHILGCSPKSRPTAKFIERHVERYKLSNESRPLLPIQNGGFPCSNDMACGGIRRGRCSTNGSCKCLDGWTGPNCLAHVGSYGDDTGGGSLNEVTGKFKSYRTRLWTMVVLL